MAVPRVDDLQGSFITIITAWNTEAKFGLQDAWNAHFEKRITSMEEQERNVWIEILSWAFFATSIFFPAISSAVAAYRAARIATVLSRKNFNSMMMNPANLRKPIRDFLNDTFEKYPEYTTISAIEADAARKAAHSAKIAVINETKLNIGEFVFSSSEKVISGMGNTTAGKQVKSISDIKEQLQNQIDEVMGKLLNKTENLAKDYVAKGIDKNTAIQLFMDTTWGNNFMWDTYSNLLNPIEVRAHYKSIFLFIIEYIKKGFATKPDYKLLSQLLNLSAGSIAFPRHSRNVILRTTFLGIQRLVVVEEWITQKGSFTLHWSKPDILKEFRDDNGFIKGGIQDFVWEFHIRVNSFNIKYGDYIRLKDILPVVQEYEYNSLLPKINNQLEINKAMDEKARSFFKDYNYG